MGKMKKIAISILSFVFMATVGLLAIVLLDSNKVAHAETLTSVSYNETYKLGETVDIQAATFDYKGKTYEANTSIRFPNGDSYKYDKLVLTKAGKYSVNFYGFSRSCRRDAYFGSLSIRSSSASERPCRYPLNISMCHRGHLV